MDDHQMRYGDRFPPDLEMEASSDLHFAWKILEFVTGPKGAVLIALLAVGAHYYRNVLFFDNRNNNHPWWLLQNVFGLIRNGLENILWYTASDRATFPGNVPSLLEDEDDEDDPYQHQDGRMKRQWTEGNHSHKKQLKQSSSSFSSWKNNRRSNSRMQQQRYSKAYGSVTAPSEELEPAFIHPEQYPAGWLVYHPTFGLIEKEKLDQTLNLKTATSAVATKSNTLQQQNIETQQLEKKQSSEEKKDDSNDSRLWVAQETEPSSFHDETAEEKTDNSVSKTATLNNDSSNVQSQENAKPGVEPKEQTALEESSPSDPSQSNSDDLRILPSSIAAGG
jgi:hypothetical protein